MGPGRRRGAGGFSRAPPSPVRRPTQPLALRHTARASSPTTASRPAVDAAQQHLWDSSPPTSARSPRHDPTRRLAAHAAAPAHRRPFLRPAPPGRPAARPPGHARASPRRARSRPRRSRTRPHRLVPPPQRAARREPRPARRALAARHRQPAPPTQARPALAARPPEPDAPHLRLGPPHHLPGLPEAPRHAHPRTAPRPRAHPRLRGRQRQPRQGARRGHGLRDPPEPLRPRRTRHLPHQAQRAAAGTPHRSAPRHRTVRTRGLRARTPRGHARLRSRSSSRPRTRATTAARRTGRHWRPCGSAGRTAVHATGASCPRASRARSRARGSR